MERGAGEVLRDYLSFETIASCYKFVAILYYKTCYGLNEKNQLL